MTKVLSFLPGVQGPAGPCFLRLLRVCLVGRAVFPVAAIAAFRCGGIYHEADLFHWLSDDGDQHVMRAVGFGY